MKYSTLRSCNTAATIVQNRREGAVSRLRSPSVDASFTFSLPYQFDSMLIGLARVSADEHQRNKVQSSVDAALRVEVGVPNDYGTNESQQHMSTDATTSPGGARILVVEDDFAIREVFQRALENAGFTIVASATAHAAIDILGQRHVDLLIVDLRLPDMSGLAFVRYLNARARTCPFIVVSGELTVGSGVEAMKLGAFDVLQKPVALERLVDVVHTCLRKKGMSHLSPRQTAIHLRDIEGHPSSAAHRWATYVLKACNADADLRTLEDWARCAGISYTTLCESCRIVGIQPHVARDFTRALRALIKSAEYQCDPSVLLNVSDRRTLRTLLDHAGPFFRPEGTGSVSEFIRHQRFVSISNEGIRILLGHFA